jgi:uncharacterized membrane protein YdjX (TVP38/TMEM64 family)
MITIPPWGLWMMFIASTLGAFLLFMQLKALGWRLV